LTVSCAGKNVNMGAHRGAPRRFLHSPSIQAGCEHPSALSHWVERLRYDPAPSVHGLVPGVLYRIEPNRCASGTLGDSVRYFRSTAKAPGARNRRTASRRCVLVPGIRTSPRIRSTSRYRTLSAPPKSLPVAYKNAWRAMVLASDAVPSPKWGTRTAGMSWFKPPGRIDCIRRLARRSRFANTGNRRA